MIGKLPSKRAIDYAVEYGSDDRPSSLRHGRKFARVEIQTRNFYGNLKTISWFYHFSENRWCITSLTLRGMAFKRLHLDSLRELYSLAYLDLQGNQLEEFDLSVLMGMRKLHTINISSNQLHKIVVVKDLYFPKLRLLNVFENDIQHFDLNFLAHSEVLERINLARNKFSKLDLSFISDLEYLNTVDLSENNLDTIDLDKFPSQISHIFLNNNKLCHIKLSKVYQNLRQIDLHNNSLTTFIDTLLHQPILEKISLWGNSLRKLDLPDALYAHLKEINLNSNKLINVKILGRFPALEVLELGYNAIETLDLHSMYSPLLQELNITCNPLHHLELPSMEKLSHLKLLDISGTAIEEMDLSGGEILEKSEIIEIGNIKYICYTLEIKGNTFKLNCPEMMILNL